MLLYNVRIPHFARYFLRWANDQRVCGIVTHSMRDSGSQPFSTATIDITERKRAEAELRKVSCAGLRQPRLVVERYGLRSEQFALFLRKDRRRPRGAVGLVTRRGYLELDRSVEDLFGVRVGREPRVSCELREYAAT